MKRTLNLLPVAEKRPIATPKHLITIAAATVLYVVVLIGVWLLNYYEANKLDAAIEALSGRKGQMQKILAVSATPGGAAGAADPAIMDMMRATPPWDAVLSELSVIVPGSIWLEIVESPDAKHLRLKGYSNSQADVAKLIEQLERSRYFGNVQIVFAQKGDKATTFELRTEMIWT